MKIILILALNLIINIAFSIQCLNPQGSPVDWYVVLKLPDVVDDGKGLKYGYFDNANPNITFYPNINDINQSPVLQTLKPYASTQTNQYAQILWNDQPNKTYSVSSSMAHAKGFMIFNNETGYIMVHTLPKFAQVANNSIILDYTTGSTWYGQHFFCISVNTQTIEMYSQQLLVDRPFVYSSQIPKNMQSNVPYSTQLLDNTKRSEFKNRTIIFQSIAGKQFVKFAKSSYLKCNFYEDLVAKQLNVSMVFETWGQGGLEQPNCEKYSVVSNLFIKMSPEISYSYTQDHSKFGISVDQNYVCFGDINRQVTQDVRGGGTVCFVSSSVHNLIDNMFADRQKCPKKSLLQYIYQFIKGLLDMIITYLRQ